MGILKTSVICAYFFVVCSLPAATRLEQALELQSKGKLKEARQMLRAAIPELRAAGDLRSLARATSLSGRIAVSLGDYPAAIQDGNAAIAVRREMKDDTGIGEDLNTLGMASLYLGKYDDALANYQDALVLDRAHHDGEGIVARMNNIGNVYYFHGAYSDALRWYQQALDTVNAAKGEPWFAWRRQVSIANLATLYQRLGKEQTALELYQQLASGSQAMPPTEYAQLLLNQGVLYRRMGDPVKALEEYRASQKLYATAHFRDGEIGAFRNIGIARAIDLNDLAGALEAFTAALDLARQSSDGRGLVLAGLYRGEVLRRLGQTAAAERDYRMALDGAEKMGLAEERWKALYGLGRMAEIQGQPNAAGDDYRKAIAAIESVRAGLRAASLRSEFLADKRDVYDSLIGVSLRQSPPPLDDIYGWMESSRARTFQERSRQSGGTAKNSLRDLQAHLPGDAVMLDLWTGNENGAALWITNSSAGVAPVESTLAELQSAVSALDDSIQRGSDAWREISRSLGVRLLKGMPAARHLIVAPDGPLSTLPFELLTDPASGMLLIERLDVSYVPAARFVAESPAHHARWRMPWSTQLLAFGDPPVSRSDTLASIESWQPLPASGDEVRAIARLLPGRSVIHLGADARKQSLLARPAGISLLHFSTHAVVDTENPDRSRILMAPDSPATPFDYIFQQEVYGLNLSGVDLVTVSACDTARGKMVRGDGIQAFSQAFLAAGAGAAITSLWRVEDRATADFMTQLYYFLARGESKSEALRSAKLQFLHSASSLHDPRFWAAFVLNGDGWDPCARVAPWTYLLAAAAVLVGLGLYIGRAVATGS